MAPIARWMFPAVILCVFSGCSLFPRALHPSQLWKMNRQDPWDEGSFSVPDPIEPRRSAGDGDGRGRATDESAAVEWTASASAE